MADNVFINGRAAIHAGSAGKSIAFPDVCLCPPSPPSGPIPTPLTNTAQAPDLQGGATTVTIEGNPVAHAKSYIGKSTGDEVAQSTGGGVITHQCNGSAYFQTFSMDVFIESQPAVRHLDLVTQNHMAPMPGNTPPAPWMSAMMAGGGAAPKESSKEEKGKGKDFIKLRIEDEDGIPLPYVEVTAKHANGTTHARTLTAGKIEIRRLPKGNVEVTLPKYDAGGWAKASPGAPVGTKAACIARQGDTVARIAWEKGFADWQAVYGDPANADLREKRPNPDILAPGDEVVIPQRKPPVFQLATGKEHVLKVKRPKVRLHLLLTDEEGTPFKNARFEILLADGPKATIKGSTNGDGILDEKIPYDEVEVDISAWPPDDPNHMCVNWRVYVGGLDPIETPTGVQARLRGLGFDCGDELGEIGPATADAIDAFKELHKIEEDETLGPKTLKKLEKEYGR